MRFRVSAELEASAKIEAARQEMTLSAWATEAIELALARGGTR